MIKETEAAMAGQTVITFHDVTVFSQMRRPTWTTAVEYLLSHAGRWVPSVEISDHVYAGICSDASPRVLIHRARRAGIPIESSELGYRIGRDNSLACPTCGSLRVRYPDGELVCYGCVGTEFVDLEVGRAPYDPSTKQGKAWTQEELDYIRDHRDTKSNAEIARDLNRTESGVRGQSTAMRLPRKAYRRNE